MTRNMISANTIVFNRLINFANGQQRSVPMPRAGRWVSSNEPDKDVLKNAKIIQKTSFGRYRHFAWLQYQDRDYLATIGFSSEMDNQQFVALDDLGGFDVCLISELPVSPIASVDEVYNVVAVGHKDDVAGYTGHPNESIVGLFPRLQVFESANPLSADIVWQLFLSMSAIESRQGGSWIEDSLAEALVKLAQSNIESFPYYELCRSTLDLDPRSLYMSLYRCVEATYAHRIASQLKSDLGSESEWVEIAATLERVMSWRPLEAESLISVLNHANQDSLRIVCECLDVDLNSDTKIQSSAAKAIYGLRNEIVHFRPGFKAVDVDGLAWNDLCRALVAIAHDVFSYTYGRSASMSQVSPPSFGRS